MKRRKFLYWVSAGMFGLGETLGIDALDRLAAATMKRGAGSSSGTGGIKAVDFGKSKSSGSSQRSSNFMTVPSGPVVDVPDDPHYEGKVDPKRLARHGRPPSRWLRSLDAEELREWLKSVSPPASGVSGMTFALHLTRDHLFEAEKVAGLTIDEQAKLHAAAHAGY